MAYRRAVCEIIEIADLNDDHERDIVGEDILKDIMPYRKQAAIWATEAKRYRAKYKGFDARIKTFTKLIPIID